MATEQITKGARADRRLTRLIGYWESKLNGTDEQVQMQAAEKLGDILLRQLELKDRREERQLKLELAGLRNAPLTAPAPQSIEETIKRLRAEMALKKANDDSEESFFD